MYPKEREEVKRVVLSSLNSLFVHSLREELGSLVRVGQVGQEGFCGLLRCGSDYFLRLRGHGEGVG